MVNGKKTATLFVVLSFVLVMPWALAEKSAIQVVTSVAPITNIVENIGGRHIVVRGIVPEGVNSHTFEPAPSDVKYLSEADLIIMNGLHLELPTIKLANKVKKQTTTIIQLGDLSIPQQAWKFDFSFPAEDGHPNPHLWPNIALAMRYAELTRDVFIKLDPEHKTQYEKNTVNYLAKLSQLDAAIFQCVQSIPEANRKLVTYHDSYAYFAPRYGMTVVGAIQPSDFAEPTPKEVIRIIKQLRRENIPAVFGSEVFPSKTLSQIAKEAGAKYVDELSDDDLPGDKDAPEHTFLGMMKQNMVVMAKSLGGDPGCVSHIDVTDLVN